MSVLGTDSRALFAAGPDRVQGTLTIMVADYFTQHRAETKFVVKDQTGRNYELHFAGEPRAGLETGMIVRSSGRISGATLEDADITVLDFGSSPRPASLASTGTSLPSITPSSGVQTTLVFNLVSGAPGAMPANFTNSQLQDRMFATSGLSVNTLYQENSFNSVSFTGDIVGPYSINAPATCNIPADIYSIQAQADQLATAAGINISAYTHYVYMMPNEMLPLCGFAGASVLGGSPGLSWINTGAYSPPNSGIYVVLAHELGHQLDMQHAQAIQSDGSLVEYGDNSCLMGDGYGYVIDFNVIHRIEEGWIPLGNILQVTVSGTYTVNFAETQSNQVQALQIADPGAIGNIYVSYRQPIGLDANLPSAFLCGASIVYWAGGSAKSQLGTNYAWGGALTDNMTYTSTDGTIAITQLSHTTTTVTVQVKTYTAPAAFTDTSAASFDAGPLASNSIVAAFGSGLSTSTATASALPLPTTLGGTTVTVQDSAGVARPAPLFYASPTQINYAIPAGTANGIAAITVADAQVSGQRGELIAAVAPGVFASGGVALGNVITSVGGNLQYSDTFQVVSGAIVPAPIDVGTGSTQVYIALYGTGIRNHVNPVTAVFSTPTPRTVTAASAGAATSVGEDQINILLPQSLKGAGLVNVTLNVDGQSANPVQVLIQ